MYRQVNEALVFGILIVCNNQHWSQLGWNKYCERLLEQTRMEKETINID